MGCNKLPTGPIQSCLHTHQATQLPNNVHLAGLAGFATHAAAKQSSKKPSPGLAEYFDALTLWKRDVASLRLQWRRELLGQHIELRRAARVTAVQKEAESSVQGAQLAQHQSKLALQEELQRAEVELRLVRELWFWLAE
jgi:hypothetical protein